MIGRSLGPYQITEPLGAGGMGEVYRARDPRLDRDVAIKVLPEDFAADPERLARFEREAKLLAQLNHPNIAGIYGLEEADGTRFIAMECVEGETLAERLARSGRIEIDEALEIARQIAEALEAAHEAGIVHRDLKPANVKITPDDKVKVLDFGLAKAWEGGGASGLTGGAADDASGIGADLSHSPTMLDATRTGVILGTAAYMSPEQARGKPVDKRADIWAFGCVLFEMLTGKRAFDGETVSDTMAAILKEEPDLTGLPTAVPASAAHVLSRCLDKDPMRRLRDIGEARIGLSGSPAADVARPPEPRQPGRVFSGALVLIGLIAGVTVGYGLWGRAGPDSVTMPITELSITLPNPVRLTAWPGRSVAISPDASRIVFAGAGSDALWVRAARDRSVVPIPGTELGRNPFFSPDGRWLAFFTDDGQLKRVALDSTGPPVTLLESVPEAEWSFGSWGDDDTIVYAPFSGGLFALTGSGDGSDHHAVTTLEAARVAAPQFLPGERAVLFHEIGAEGTSIRAIDLARPGSGARQVVPNASHPRYLESGHLLFLRDGVLFVAAFDTRALELVGNSVPVPRQIAVDDFRWRYGTPQLAVSQRGTLVYAPALSDAMRTESEIVWVNRDQSVESIATVPFPLPWLQLSPDERRVAFEYRAGPWVRLSIYDLASGRDHLATSFDAPFPTMPLWRPPDGAWIALTRDDGVRNEAYLLATDGGGETSLLEMESSWLTLRPFTDDGRMLSYETADEIGILELEAAPGEERRRRFLANAPNAFRHSLVLSPDGEWAAWVSNETGENRGYVSEYPSGQQRLPASAFESDAPMWSPDGGEIIFQSTREPKWWGVTVETDPELTLSEPRLVAEGPFLKSSNDGFAWDIARDGRLLMVRGDEPIRQYSEYVVVFDWFHELQNLVPTEPSR